MKGAAEWAGGIYLSIPDPVDDARVDEADDGDAVEEVARERAALGDGARDDGGGGGGEGVLEEEADPVVADVAEARLPVVDSREREVSGAGADEGVGDVAVVAVVGVVGEAVAEQVPDEAAKASIHDRLEQDVLDVLHADGARREEREARLHDEDEGSAHEQVEGVVLGRHHALGCLERCDALEKGIVVAQGDGHGGESCGAGGGGWGGAR